MHIVFKVIIGIVVVLAVIIGGMMIYITRGLKEGKEVVINSVDFAQLKDGIYTGKYDFGRWANEVEVTVKDKKVTSINIIKDVKFPVDTAKVVINTVIEKQTLSVDIISGATITSKSYLKAIENALV